MPAASPVVSSTITARKGTSSSPKMGTGASRKSSLASTVRRMGALCTSRRCGPIERASAYGNARNVTRSALMGRFQVRQPFPANAVPAFSAKSCDRILSADIANLNLSFGQDSWNGASKILPTTPLGRTVPSRQQICFPPRPRSKQAAPVPARPPSET